MRCDGIKLIHEVLRGLTPREEKITKLLFGIADGEEYSTSEIGEHFLVNRQRIWQIRQKIIKKLRYETRLTQLRLASSMM